MTIIRGYESVAVILLAITAAVGSNIPLNVSRIGQRIANGELTKLGEYPETVSLGLTAWGDVYHVHLCAGSILTELWVVTAATCVADSVDDVARYYWLAGTNNLRNGGNQYEIREIHIHPEFNSSISLLHNVALTKVRLPILFSTTIQPIQLAVETELESSGIVVGWGQVSQTLIQPDVKRKIQVSLVDIDVCRDIYSIWDLEIDGDYEFCAIAPAAEPSGMKVEVTAPENRGACRGDEGGPFFQGEATLPRVVGFVSWTFGCGGTTEYPTIYIDIMSYFDWISKTTGYIL